MNDLESGIPDLNMKSLMALKKYLYLESLFVEIFTVPSNHVWLRANACKLPDRLEQTFAFFCCLLVVAYFVYILAKMELKSSEGPLYFYIERENVPESETESVITWSSPL